MKGEVGVMKLMLLGRIPSFSTCNIEEDSEQQHGNLLLSKCIIHPVVIGLRTRVLGMSRILPGAPCCPASLYWYIHSWNIPRRDHGSCPVSLYRYIFLEYSSTRLWNSFSGPVFHKV